MSEQEQNTSDGRKKLRAKPFRGMYDKAMHIRFNRAEHTFIYELASAENISFNDAVKKIIQEAMKNDKS